MKKGILVAALLVALGFSAPRASAHNANQLPFVAINGQDLLVYHVGSTSLANAVLPQDEPPASYVVGQNLHIELKTVNLPFPAELIPSLVFSWTLGDGATASGSSVDHAYSKPGTYIISLISTNPGDTAGPQPLDIIYVNVLPNASYVLPTSIIKVDGKKSSNPYTDILNSDFSAPLSMDASASVAGSSPIVSYAWDFGDQNPGQGEKTTHTYGRDWSYVSVWLRVITKDGFYADSMVQIENPDPIVGTPAASSTPAPAASASHSKAQVVAAALAVVAVLGFGYAAYRRRKRPTS